MLELINVTKRFGGLLAVNDLSFTVEAGGQSNVWVQVLPPPTFISGRAQSIYVLFGNRGTVDAYGVPVETLIRTDVPCRA